MPNHITCQSYGLTGKTRSVANRLTLLCDSPTVKTILERYATSDTDECCVVADPSIHNIDVWMFPDFEKVIPHPNPSYSNNLSWHVQNWGSKWNSYDHFVVESPNSFGFKTAWSAVVPIITAMSKTFPDVVMVYEYADEDTGYNNGIFTFFNGKIIGQYEPEDGSLEAYQLSFRLNPEDEQLYKLVGDKYIYIEDAE